MAAPIIISSPDVPVDPEAPPVGPGTTLARYVDVLAEELGFRHATSVTSVASNAEAKRTLLISDFRDDEYDEGEIGGWWVYVVDGAQIGAQRRILKLGHYGAEGAFMVSRPFAEPLLPSTTVILTSPLPIRRHLGIKGITELVNEALDRIYVEGLLSFTGTGSNLHALTTWPFLREASQTTGLYDRLSGISGSNATELSGGGYRITASNIDVNLVTDSVYGTNAPFWLGVIARASELVRTGASWAFGGTGLTAWTDQAAAPEDWVRTFGMVKALEYLEILYDADEKLTDAKRDRLMRRLARRLPRYATAAAKIALTQFPEPYHQAHDSIVGSAWTAERYATTEAVPY